MAGSATSGPADRRAPAAVPAALEAAAFRVARHIDEYRLPPPGQHVLAAFSGGPDSSALALILDHLGYRVTLGHVDHGLRADSALDGRHCRRVAGQMGLSCLSQKVTVPGRSEGAARKVRYPALEAMRRAAGAKWIATGHTVDDNAETVTMRLARGGFGLGIAVERGAIFRPLLCLRRAETERVCSAAGVLFLRDPSNADLTHTRNRVRAELQKAGGAEIERLAALGEFNYRNASHERQRVQKLLSSFATRGPGWLELDRAALSALSGDAGPVVRAVLEELGIDPSCRLVDDIVAKVLPVTGAGLDLPGGFRAWSEPRSLLIGRPPAQTPHLAFEISAPGVTCSDAWGLEVSVTGAVPAAQAGLKSTGLFEQWFDAGVLGSELLISSARKGDTFYPLGLGGKKKVSGFLADQKVPRRLRNRVPLLVSGSSIAWVAGLRADDRFKVTGQSEFAVKVSVYPRRAAP